MLRAVLANAVSRSGNLAWQQRHLCLATAALMLARTCTPVCCVKVLPWVRAGRTLQR